MSDTKDLKNKVIEAVGKIKPVKDFSTDEDNNLLIPRYVHNRKILRKYFVAIQSGLKMFEIRKQDEKRPFHVGDLINLIEVDDEAPSMFAGYSAIFTICYVTNYEQKPGYYVLGLNNKIQQQHVSKKSDLFEKDTLE